MEKAFKDLIKTQYPFLVGGKLLLAISGGVDSVVLADLCAKAKLNFSLAHCNFNLRGEESDEDEKFVVALAEAMDVEVFTENFDTETYAKDAGISIQMAARELRYNWFEELSSMLKFDYLLTAHHANDNLETFLINLVRGTGLEGLSGIKDVHNDIIRPLLPFTRKEIEAYAETHKISWREDSSNASTKYLRNKIRHDIVPLLEQINPQFLDSFAQTQSHLKESFDLVEDYMSLIYPEVVKKSKYGYQLDIAFLKRIPNTGAVLYQLLKSFGFTEWNDILNLLDAQPGKKVYSPTHRLIKDRDVLILTDLKDGSLDRAYHIEELEDYVMLPMGTFSFEEVDKISNTASNIIYVAKETLNFPLEIRRWKKGDIFYPFGMKGKKKISNFFKDKKLTLPEKENTWLLCSNEKIMWVVNQRADDRFAIKDPNQKIVKITYNI